MRILIKKTFFSLEFKSFKLFQIFIFHATKSNKYSKSSKDLNKIGFKNGLVFNSFFYFTYSYQAQLEGYSNQKMLIKILNSFFTRSKVLKST